MPSPLRNTLSTLVVILLLAGLVVFWWMYSKPNQVPRQSGTEASSTPARSDTYQNAAYGYSFTYPSDYSVREYTPEYVSIGYPTADGFDPLVEVGIAQSEGEGTFSSFSAYVKSKAEALCAADGPNGSVRCSVARSDPYPSPTGLSGSMLHLDLTTTHNGTSSTETAGPVYAFNVGANTPDSKYGALLISPSLTHATDTVAVSLASSIAESLVLNKVETRP